MHSFIVVSESKEKQEEFLTSFYTEKRIGKFDIHIFTPEENSFGIKEVRNIIQQSFIKPSGENKVLVLQSAELLTTEAQNALLKLLEEPPAHTFVVLCATTSAFFLPTILSRCKIISIEQEEQSLLPEEAELLTKQVEILIQKSVGQKLVLAEALAGKKEMLQKWFDNMLYFLRTKMLTNPEEKAYPKLIQQIQNARGLFLTTNVSPRIILEHAFLSL